MHRSEFVTVPPFSPQPAAGRTTCARAVESVGQQSLTDKWAGAEPSANLRRARNAGCRVGAEDPYGFNAAREHRLEQLGCLQARLRRDARRTPKPPHAVDVGRVRETHMGGELIGKPANFAPAHRIALAG
jgi:hypothetical protein